MSIPMKMLMSVAKAKAHPVISKIMQENQKVFNEENQEFEQMTLCLFLFYEISRGKDSYWYPYLLQMPTVQFSCMWTHLELRACQDPWLSAQMKEYRIELRH